MFHRWLDVLRHEVSGTRALDSVAALARFHRVQASPGLDQAADWVAAQLEAAGLQVRMERVPSDGTTRLLGQVMPQGWSCDKAWADLIEGGRRERLCDVEANALSLVLRSAPARGRFPLIVVDEGTEDSEYQDREVRGCVVLARGDVHRVHELAVLRRGAAGLLTDTRRLVPPVRERDDETDALNYTSFWWAEEEPRGWGFVVSPAVGDALRERLRQGARLELEVEIESRAFDTTLPLLSGVIPGSTAFETLIVSHLCHPRPSANDNASGAAANLEAARALASRIGRGDLPPPRNAMRFLWVPELTGTHAYFAQDPARAGRITAALNLDMVGEDQEQCGSTFLLEHPPSWCATFAETLLGRIRREAVDWVSSYSGPGHYSMTRMSEVPFGGGSDHAVLIDPGIGVPCPMLIQWPDRFYHSSHDTPDKCSPASLALAARCAGTYAGFLASATRAETAWLTELVERDARRRLLEAMDREEAARHLEREALRGARALHSLGRLEVSPSRIAEAQRGLEAFHRREAGDADRLPAATARSGARRPRRALAVPLGFPRRLMPGWRNVPPELREAWRRRELETPDAYVVSELAWMACDGQRTLDEIEHLVWLESGRRDRAFLTAFFDLTARLGLSEWTLEEDAACNPSAPGTAGP